jgi:hypothetical protein
MKNFLFLFLALFLFACKKEVSPEFSGTATLKINGELKQLKAESIFPSSPFATNTFNIKFYDGNVTNLFLSAQKTGNISANNNTIFPFGVSGTDGASAGLTTDLVKDDTYYVAPSAIPSNGSQGNIVIDKWTSDEIEGTFSFFAVGQNKPTVQVKVTEGKFSVKRN